MKMSFREEVYAAVRKIPSGCVATYGEIALMVGRPGAARAVGNALHANPYEMGRLRLGLDLAGLKNKRLDCWLRGWKWLMRGW